MKTAIKNAVALLQAGGLVALPTETVYGLGADARNDTALRKIFAVKERPLNHPLIVHLADFSQVSSWAREIPDTAVKLAQACWPGPLTLILKKQPQVSPLLTGHQDSIGLRIPRHPLAQALLQAFGSGLAAPSANKFTHISPTTAGAVRQELGAEVDLILEGGECEVGLESTIVDLTQDTPRILRPGMLGADRIEQILGAPVMTASKDIPLVRTPGMHHLHYAPVTPTVLLARKDIADFLQALHTDDLPAALLTHSNLVLPTVKKIHHLKLPPDAITYAHDLYRTLRELDNLHFQCIIIEDVPALPAWEAIHDRLNKASGRRV